MDFKVRGAKVKYGERRMFSQVEETLRVATVELRGYTFTFSMWMDEDEWLADSCIGPEGQPIFVHGEGARETMKRAASPDIQDALNEHFRL